MWQDKLKEIIYILENSSVNEIEISFGVKNIVFQNNLARYITAMLTQLH